MTFRPAEKEDLPQLKTIYQKIICNMNQNNIRIWDEIYPCEFFADDIENGCLYVLTENDSIMAAVALYQSNDGEDRVKWKNQKGKAVYLDRLGVGADHLRKGIGGLMLKNAGELAGRLGAEYLRLFVVDVNKPAINLYLKNGFERADGIYEEKIGDSVLVEYGFETEIPKMKPATCDSV